MSRQRQILELCCHDLRAAWDHQKLEEAMLDHPLEALQGAGPCQHLDFLISILQNYKKKVSVILNNLICGTLLWQN